jgi:hypothetical protein
MKKSLLIAILLMGTIFIIHDTIIAQVQVANGKIGIEVSALGRVRIYSPGVFDPSDATKNRQIDRFSILVSGSVGHVFDYYNDLLILTGPTLVTAPQKSDIEIDFTGDNTYNTPPLPPNVGEELKIYTWTNANYLLIKVTITNKETSVLAAHIGAEILPWNGNETNVYDNTTGIFSTNTATYPFIGFKELSQTVQSVKSIDWVSSYYNSDTDLYNWFLSGSIQSTYTTTSADGTVMFYSGPVVSLNPQATKVVWTAVSLGTTSADMKTNMDAAVVKYNTLFSSVKPIEGLPTGFALTQNYPNPFNPTTKINFSLINNEFVNLSVYDVLGQKVAELVNSNMNAGNYKVDFDASKLSTGVYIYRLTTPTQSISKKMSLLK